MQANAKVGHPARLSDVDREYLEALRDYGTKTQWKIANYVWQIHDAYNFQDHDVGAIWPRSEVADACGVLPKEVDSMVSTVERVGWLAETSGLDVCYNAWKYIARHEDPQDFLSHLLRSMDDYGGRFPPVSAIRMKLKASKGNPPPDKPREWRNCQMIDQDRYGNITLWIPGEHVEQFDVNARYTLTEATDAAGRATRTATDAGRAEAEAEAYPKGRGML